MEDLSKTEYLVRRQAIEEQLERTGLPLDPRIDKAEEILAVFGRKFWDHETEAAERRRPVASSSRACGKRRATSWL